VTKLLEACIAASPPPGTATPTCNGAKKEPSLPRAYLLLYILLLLLLLLFYLIDRLNTISGKSQC